MRWTIAIAACVAPEWALAGEGLGEATSWVWALPFAGLLLSIALLPVVAARFWHHLHNQLLVALAWASPVAIWLGYAAITDPGALGHDAAHALGHAAAEYGSFMVLLGSLYVVSGGILVRGDLRATPRVNTAFLLIGGLLANVIGTTGASMLLIRPVLRTNNERQRTWHIPVFFIFVVSNVGGTLTPIGDPPLFLGYLRGVPFGWTAQHLWAPWLFTILVLLAVFFAFDTIQYRKESSAAVREDDRSVEPIVVEGGRNALALAGIILSVLLLSPERGVDDLRVYPIREVVMIAIAGASFVMTAPSVRARNRYSWGPILEVGALFVGIFVAMIPVTAWVEAQGAALGVDAPWQYFLASASLSAFLDNAPTYVTFASLACGVDPSCVDANDLAPLAAGAFAPALMAVALGSVFGGACSYIGNGPNFMVRSIATEAGYAMPSFFGYCGWAALVLWPTYAVMVLLWLV